MSESVTEEFCKDRVNAYSVDELETGVWYSGFNKVKEYAITNKIPFVSVWSNGDACGFCKKLELNFMTDIFKTWMKTSGCMFSFGHSKDELVEDRVACYNWSGHGINVFPFMRFYWTDGENTVGKISPGNKWNDGLAGDDGASAVIAKLDGLLEQVDSYSKSLKIRTNPDWNEEQVEEFRQSIRDNEGYCPCVERSEDSKCMCKWFREKTDEGLCHCELYQKYLG